MHRALIPLLLTLLLTACGGPSEADIQATIAAGMQATTTALEAQTAAVVAVTATAQADRCGPTGLAAYADTIEQQIGAFERQSDVVASVPRIGIATPLQELVNIQEATRALDTPPCLVNFHDAVLNAMDWYQAGFRAFAAQAGDQTVTVNFRIGDQQFALIKAGLAQLREGQIPVITIPQSAPGGG